MASIVERRGRFCVVYSYKDKNGKRRQKWETYKTMSEAKKRKKEIEYRADIGQMIVPHCKTVKELLEERKDYINFDHIDLSDDIAKVSIVGAGMINNPGVASDMFGALYTANININMISTSEIKVSVLVDIADADRAVQVIHNQFFKEFG